MYALSGLLLLGPRIKHGTDVPLEKPPYPDLLFVNRSQNSSFLHIYSTRKSTRHTHLAPLLVASVYMIPNHLLFE